MNTLFQFKLIASIGFNILTNNNLMYERESDWHVNQVGLTIEGNLNRHRHEHKKYHMKR